jgi:hypothetical protein
MQTTLATLLLITSAVVLTAVVVDYAVVIVEETLRTTNSTQLDRIRDINYALLNQTDNILNQTQPNIQNTPP